MHAWITVERNGQIKDYSLWQSGVEQGRDEGQKGTANLYAKLTPEQEAKLQKALEQPQEYSKFTNNCSHFVADIYEQTTGRELPNADRIGAREFGTPYGLEQSIRTHKLDLQFEHREVSAPAQEQNRQPSPEERQAELTRLRQEARAADRASLLSSLSRDDKETRGR